MKKIFNYAMMSFVAVAALVITASCGDDDDKVKNYDVTVSVALPDGYSFSDLEDLNVVLTSEKGKEYTVAMTAASQTVNVVEGMYSITASGKVKGENYTYLTGASNQQPVYQNTALTIGLAKVIQSPLVFKRLYINGGYKYYMKDSYFEIVNNSDEVQYLDRLILTSPMNFSKPTPWQEAGAEYAKLYPCGQGSVVMFPGNGTDYPIQPGQSVIVANNATNHTVEGVPTDEEDITEGVVSPDLSTADWEIYLDYNQNDTDYPNTPNLLTIFHNNAYMFAFGLGVSGRGYVLARLPENLSVEQFVDEDGQYVMYEPNSQSTYMNYLVVPSDWVLDAVEVVASDDSDDEYIPLFLVKDDAHGVKGNPMYSGKAIQRKVARTAGDRVYYLDTNNSANDFEIGISAAIK